jgi:uncharacterized protein (TIGR00730 family)
VDAVSDVREPKTTDEELLHAQDPSVATELGDARRVANVERELADGFRRLSAVGPAVTIFGSARTPEADPEYGAARRLARHLGEAGYATITGGGPGIMEAANRGARDVGTPSIGIGIELEFEQRLNDYVDLGITCHYFFTRKVMFVRYASAFVCFPGGFGTLDELFEVLTLRQTRKIDPFPVVLVGTDYWGGLKRWLDDTARVEGKIAPADVEGFVVTDDLDEVLDRVKAGRPRPTRD